MNIIKKIESARGCGYRKKGGVYLVSDGAGQPCYKLPVELNVCPCCGAGIKFSRGFTWITAQLFIDSPCEPNKLLVDADPCIGCPLSFSDPKQKFGLMWVGEKFYTADEFRIEAIQKGISKRIASIPRNFKVGETWIMLAHIKGGSRVVTIEDKPVKQFFPAIFHALKPSRIEYVITGEETEEMLNDMEKRGITLVDVIRDIDTQATIDFNNETEIPYNDKV